MNHRSNRMPARVAAAAVLALHAVAAAPALAQQGDRDYYTPDASNVDVELRRNVESHHLGPGLQYMREGKWSGAKAHFEFILNYYPNHPQALNQISELCDVRWVNVRCDSASWFARALARNPSIAQTYVLYGIHLHRRKKLDDAIEAYGKALSMNAKSMNAHYNLALAHLDRKEYALANRHAQISYALGAALPGLRDRLKGAGKWQPLSDDELRKALEPAEEKA